MNPAEEIVKFWLQHHGYFVMSSIHVPRGQNKEIDILAIHEKEGRRKHIEVQVSVHSLNFKRTPQMTALYYKEEKFEHPKVLQEVHNRFGGDFSYEKELVLGEVSLKGKDVIIPLTDECKSLGITVIPFSQILREVATELGTGTHLNPIIKAIQLCNKFL